MGFQDSSWNICISSLVILAESVFEISDGKNRQTNSNENLTLTTVVSVRNETVKHSIVEKNTAI